MFSEISMFCPKGVVLKSLAPECSRRLCSKVASKRQWIERPSTTIGTQDLVNTTVQLGAYRKSYVHDINLEPPNDPYRPYHESLGHDDYFDVKKSFTMREMVEARVFLGHKVGTLRAEMKQYLAGERLGVCVFDLDVTARHLNAALNFLAHVAYRGGVVLFVTNNRFMVHDVEKAAQECGEFSHCHNFEHGVFTNMLKTYGHEVRLPDVVLFMDTMFMSQESFAVHEAAKMQISTVAVVDSNCNPNLITYPVPGNDDTKQSIMFFLKKFCNAIMAGKLKRQQHFGVSIKTESLDL